MVLFVYNGHIMIKEYNKKKMQIQLKRLEKRVAIAKKVLYSNPYKSLFEVMNIIKNTNNEKETHYVKN